MIDLHYLTAAEALRLFRVRELSPVELVSAVINHAEAVEPVINAFAETLYEQALDQARIAYSANLGCYEVDADVAAKDFDALVCPTFAVPALTAEYDPG